MQPRRSIFAFQERFAEVFKLGQLGDPYQQDLTLLGRGLAKPATHEPQQHLPLALFQPLLQPLLHPFFCNTRHNPLSFR